MLLADRMRVARRQHRCDWCDQPILVGHVYRDSRSAHDGTVSSFKSHPACDAFVAQHLESWEYDYIADPRDTFTELVAEFGDPASDRVDRAVLPPRDASPTSTVTGTAPVGSGPINAHSQQCSCARAGTDTAWLRCVQCAPETTP